MLRPRRIRPALWSCHSDCQELIAPFMSLPQFVEEPFPEAPDLREIRLRTQGDEAVPLDRHDVAGEGEANLPGREFLLSQQQSVQTTPKPVHGGPDGKKGAVEPGSPLQAEPHLAMASCPIPPAQD